MSMTDTVADFFTRIRNAAAANHEKTLSPYSNLRKAVGELLVREGFLEDVRETEVEGKRWLHVRIRYTADGNPVIERLERVSKPGRRIYHDTRSLPSVRRGLGVGIYSTNKGVLTDRECREQRVGGEYIGRVW